MAWWLFQNVVITTGLALVVWAICRTVRPGPAGRHALWLIVLVKFVTPPLVVWPWAAPDPFGVAAWAASEAPAAPAVIAGVDHDVTSRLPALAAAEPHPATPVDARATPATEPLVAHLPWLLVVWIAGSVGLLAIECVRTMRLRRRLKHSTAAPAALQARADAIAGQLGLSSVPLRVLDDATPPAVWGLGRPVILWPRTLPGIGEPLRSAPTGCDDRRPAASIAVDALLLHELAHVKRRDHLIGWVELAAGVAWWWNPLFWYVRAQLREQAELACDTWVITALPNGRRAYAESLLMLSGAGPRATTSLAAIGIRASSRRVLERRLVMIMQGRAPLRLTRAGLVTLAMIGLVSLPGWAAPQYPPPPPAPPAVPGPPAMPAPPAPPPPAAPTPESPAAAGLPPEWQTPPSPPPPPARRFRSAPQTPPPPPPPPAPARVLREPTQPAPMRVGVPSPRNLTVRVPSLPADGQDLLRGYEQDLDALRAELDQKMAARREALRKSLLDLQEQYTRAGKLDEAVQIRDFIRARMSQPDGRWIRRER